MLGLLRIVNLNYTFFLVFVLVGAWTVAYGFALAGPIDHIRFIVSGVILASIGSFFILSLSYAAAVFLIAIIIDILIVGLRSRSPVGQRGKTGQQLRQ